MATVIAEFCQNHNGKKEILEQMILAAAEAGADYAKIQTIFADDLSFRPRFEDGGFQNGDMKIIKRPYTSEYDRLKKLEVPFEWYGWYIDTCKEAGIRPLTTVFNRSHIEKVSSYEWDSVKVASYDCASFPLLRDLKKYFKHIFVSTGSTYDNEIIEAVEVLEGTSFTLLHCVTIYPTPLDEVNLARLEFLKQFTPSVGFSDHTLVSKDTIKASVVALHLGADVIERHFTLLAPEKTKDGPISINKQQLTQLCSLAHGSKNAVNAYIQEEIGDYTEMIGNKYRELSDTEILNRDYYRGRFINKVHGQKFTFNWE
ncbi:MAG: N-acetylneuraminate synthase family protein [Methanoregulaceae archaeon]|jgi:sialic acid synthase SpsE